MIALSLDRQTPFILESERSLPKEKVPTTWKLGPLSASQMARVCDARMKGDGAAGALICLLGGLHGWSSFFDIDGNRVCHVVGVNGEACAIEVIDRIPQDVRFELGRKIYEISDLPPEKKSAST